MKRDLEEPINAEFQLDELSEIILGTRDGDFLEMIDRVRFLNTSYLILTRSQNAMARRKDICEAVDQLMVELDALSED